MTARIVAAAAIGYAGRMSATPPPEPPVSPPPPSPILDFLRRARAEGVLDEAAFERLAARAATEATPPADAPVQPSALEVAAREAQARREREAQAREAALSEARARRVAALEREAAQARARREARGAQVGLVEALFSGTAAGVDGLLELATEADGRPAGRTRDEVLPAVYENVGWLLGALLVISGSIYGLREAWTTFGPVGRFLSVGAALFAYHGLFAMLAALLSRRSARAAAFLAGTGTCLVPLAAVAFARLPSVGAPLPVSAAAAVGLLAASTLTLTGVARRFDAPAWAFRAAVLCGPAAILLGPFLPTGGRGLGLTPLLPLFALLGPGLWPRVGRGGLGAWILVLLTALGAELAFLGAPGPTAAADLGEAGDLASGAWRVAGQTNQAWLLLYIAGLGAALAQARRLATVRRAAEGLRFAGVALGALAGVLSAVAALGGDDPPRSLLAQCLVALGLGAWPLVPALVRGRAAFFPLLALVSLGVAIGARLVFPEAWAAPRWALSAFCVPAAWLLFSLRRGGASARRLDAAALVWALCLWGALARIEPAETFGLAPLSLLAALALGLICHTAAADAPAWHWAGGALIALGPLVPLFAVLGGSDPLRATGPLLLLSGLGLAYFAVARWLGRRVSTDGEGPAQSPLDDVSLAYLLCAAGLCAASLAGLAPASGLPPWSLAPALLASAALALRSPWDQSGLPALVAAVSLSFSALGALGLLTAGARAGLLGVAAAACVALAAALTSPERPATPGRLVFGRHELPFGAAGRNALGDGLGLASLVLALAGATQGLLWFGDPTTDRDLAILGAAALAAASALAFATRGLQIAGVRGRGTALWAMAGFATLAAVTNRIGRPLPPDVVARNLTLIGAGLWAASVGLRRVGPWLGERLAGEAAAGAGHHRVPQLGAVALASLLLVDVALLHPTPVYRGLAVVPPLMVLGPAVLWALLARSTRRAEPLQLSAALLVLGAGLAAAQGALLGPGLSPLLPPGGGWVPVDTMGGLPQGDAAALATLALPERYGVAELAARLAQLHRALLGLTLAGAVLAAVVAVAGRSSAVSRALDRALLATDAAGADATLATAAALSVWLAFAAGWFVAPVPAAGAALFTGLALVLRAPGGPRTSGSAARLTALAGGALLVHALAQTQGEATGALPPWPGPVLALLAVVLVAAALRALPTARAPHRTLRAAQWAAAGAAVLALVYACAVGAPTTLLAAGPGTVSNALARFLWAPLTPVAGLTCALLGIGALLGAHGWGRLGRPWPTRRGVLRASGLFAFALVTLAFDRLAPEGPAVAAVVATCLAALATAAHVGGRLARASAPELAAALRLSRDASLGAAALALAIAANAARSLADAGVDAPDPPYIAAGLLTLGLGCAVALHAFIAERTVRHVYAAELSILWAYAYLRTAGVSGLAGLRPEHDALFCLGLGFALVGVAVLARRSGRPEAADATRRVAALLPILGAAALPFTATGENVALALAAAGFYAVLGWVERSRVLGTGGAVGVNLALLLLALREGYTGPDVLLAPFGLLLLMTVHLFAAQMEAGTRLWLRFAGTALTFAPAGLAIVLQVGDARSTLYPLVFGGACLLGIGLGMALHIRAYLVLGLGFLLLDLGAMLVRTSLQDRRLAFFALSLAGLAILAGMVGYTLRKEAVWRVLGRLRRALRTWD